MSQQINAPTGSDWLLDAIKGINSSLSGSPLEKYFVLDNNGKHIVDINDPKAVEIFNLITEWQKQVNDTIDPEVKEYLIREGLEIRMLEIANRPDK